MDFNLKRRMFNTAMQNLRRLPNLIRGRNGGFPSIGALNFNSNLQSIRAPIRMPFPRLPSIFNNAVANAQVGDFWQRGRVNVPRSSVAVVLTLLTLSVSSWVNFDQMRDFVQNNEVRSIDPKCRFDTYDYIVVGGGTAGMVVATRLANASANTMRVLLLEAGGEPHPLNNLAAFDLFMSALPENNWVYKTTPQMNSSQAFEGKRIRSFRGKMLGGSSSTNLMFYVRGHKEDFNRWAVDVEDPEWNYENVLPYFKKSEDYHGVYKGQAGTDRYHGKGGLLRVSPREFTPGIQQFLAAGHEKGYDIGDYNGWEGENQEVMFTKIDSTVWQGKRESSYTSFYLNTGKPRNLCIKKFAHVTKINFVLGLGRNGDLVPRATGVTYRRQGELKSVVATREVILTAGPMESPRLLLQSGIGPKEDLERLGIPVVKDSPVGEGLQDHTFIMVGPFFKEPRANPVRNFVGRYLVNLEDFPSNPIGFTGQAFLQSPFAQPPYPDIQFFPLTFPLFPDLPQYLNQFTGMKLELIQKWVEPYMGLHRPMEVIIVAVLLGRPKSSGKLTLATSDPEDDLLIDPRYLSHPDDMEALLWAYKRVLDVYENTTSLNLPLFHKPFPACESEEFRSDEYFRCFIRHVSNSFYHTVGTCSLGKVVDSHLRVKGVDGLRVIDSSVMPRTPMGNTCAATIMIAEKGVDYIVRDLMDWNKIFTMTP